MDYTEKRMRFDALRGRINTGFAEVERAIEGGTARPEMLEPVNADIAEMADLAAGAHRDLLEPVNRALAEGRLEDALKHLREGEGALARMAQYAADAERNAPAPVPSLRDHPATRRSGGTGMARRTTGEGCDE